MSATVDLFRSFCNPTSSLAMPGAWKRGGNSKAEIGFRPVPPLAVRDPAFFGEDRVEALRWRLGRRGLPHRSSAAIA